MKKYLLMFMAGSTFAATNEFDLKKGIDLTGQTSVTFSQLNQLVDNGTVATNKGMIVIGATTPDYANNPRYTNFLWLDISYQPPRVKAWNSTAGTWNEIISTNVVIPDGTITSAKIVNGTITSDDISDGTISSADMSTGVITSNLLSANSVYTAAIIDGHVTTAKLATGAVGNSLQIANGIIQSNHIAADSIEGALIKNLGVRSGKLDSNVVNSVNITDGTISSNDIANNTITTNNLSTNILNSLTTGWAVYEAVGNTIVNQNGIFSGVTSNAVGVLTFTFTTPRANTNYFVSALASDTDHSGAITDLVVSLRSNVTSFLTLKINDNNAEADAAPARLYIQVIGN